MQKQILALSCILRMPQLKAMTKHFVRTVDRDIIVLAIAFFDCLGLSELWIGFGTGKHYRDIAIHNIHAELGTSK